MSHPQSLKGTLRTSFVECPATVGHRGTLFSAFRAWPYYLSSRPGASWWRGCALARRLHGLNKGAWLSYYHVRITERSQRHDEVKNEAGIADAYGRERTVIVEVGPTKPFSDVSGCHVVRYDGSREAECTG